MNLKELSISLSIGKTNQVLTGDIVLLLKAVGRSLILEKLCLDLLSATKMNNEVVVVVPETSGYSNDIVWNMPRLSTLTLSSSVLPVQLIIPSLIQAKILLPNERDILRTFNDFSHVPSVHVEVCTYDDTKYYKDDDHNHDDRKQSMWIVSPVSFATTSLVAKNISNKLFNTLYNMTLLTHVDITLSSVLLPSYNMLGNLLGCWPCARTVCIRKIKINTSNTIIHGPESSLSGIYGSLFKSKSSSTSMSTCHIRLPHLTKLVLYGWDQQLVHRLICPKLIILDIGCYKPTSINSPTEKTLLELNMTAFISASPKLTTLSTGYPLKSYCRMVNLENLTISIPSLNDGSISTMISCCYSSIIQSLEIQTDWTNDTLAELCDAIPSSSSLNRLSLGFPTEIHDTQFSESQIEIVIKTISKCIHLKSLLIPMFHYFVNHTLTREYVRRNPHVDISNYCKHH
jgi:hypothetical protein